MFLSSNGVHAPVNSGMHPVRTGEPLPYMYIAIFLFMTYFLNCCGYHISESRHGLVFVMFYNGSQV
jgi:hypothetical protein